MLYTEKLHVSHIQIPIPPSLATDQWDFEETLGDKISDGNVFGGTVESNRFEPCASDSEEEGGSVREDESVGHMITSARWGLIFHWIRGL